MRCLRFLAPLLLAAGPGLSRPAADLGTIRVAEALIRPVYVTHAPDDFARIFIVEKRGVIKTLELATGTVSTFMDINARVGGGGTNNSEQGLLGLAFHPQYQTNGFFYVDYTDTLGDTVVSRFSVLGDPATSNTGDDTTELVLLNIDQPQSNHNGGWIDFGPSDGYLYIATGDGGNRCDSGAGHTTGVGNAQDITDNLLGKILRIDVDGGSPYAIPADNPFVGIPGDDEIWAFGLRNPYRCSFDQATGDLYIGDVGQDEEEEVDYQPASSVGGENYGWPCLEGTTCPDGASNCAVVANCNCPDGTPGLVGPVFAYNHNPPLAPAATVCSVISGYVYRGECLPELAGHYLFADFCAGANSIWSFQIVGGMQTNFLFRDELSPSLDGINVNQIVSFGEDASGELYIVDQGTGTNGNIFKIVPVALVANRSQAPNPDSYTTQPVILGGTFSATVDNNLAGQSASALFAFDTPTQLVLGSGQVLLALDLGGSGEQLSGAGLAPTSSLAGVDSYQLPVPGSPILCGLELYSQAIQFGNPPFVLSNAQDLTVGF